MVIKKTTGTLAACLPSGVAKSFFILALVFLNAICFATEQEEINRLNEINAIAITELELGYSPSKLVHDTYISLAKDRGEKFSVKEANAALPYISAEVGKKVDMTKCFKQSIVDNYMAAFKKNPTDLESLTGVFVQPMLVTLQSPRDTRVATCGLAAFYTLNAVVFDIMNQQVASKKPKLLFASAIILSTVGASGDHVAVMVAGSSGAVYLVDPWMNKVVPIQGFSKKSGWNSVGLQSLLDITLRHPLPLPPKGDLNLTINELVFKDMGYYDMVYVAPDTQWELLIPFSKHMRQLLQTRNDNIRPLYDNMMPAFGWKPYSELFDGDKVSSPDKTSDTKEKPEEEK